MRNLFVMLFLAILGVTEAPDALDSYVLRVGDSTTINGNFDDAGTLRMQERFGSRYFWFKRDGQAYVVSDAKVIERASAIVRPQHDLGVKQGALGRKQAALGEKQAALGMKQATLRGLRPILHHAEDLGEAGADGQAVGVGDQPSGAAEARDDRRPPSDVLGAGHQP